MTDPIVMLLSEALKDVSNEAELKERLTDLELALENADWQRLSWQSDQEFSRPGLKTIARLARIMDLKNPLVRRGVSLQAFYVFGRGVNISAKDEDINAVVQRFLDDQHNQRELTGAIARKQKDIDLRLDGNLFLTLFMHPVTGNLRVSDIPVAEIDDIISNPQNKSETRWYKRQWTYQEFDEATGTSKDVSTSRYYRDYRYENGREVKSIGGIDVDPNPVYHIKTGSFSDWRFGVSEVYSTLDWAKAYTSFLSDFATVIKALARFAWNMKTTGGATGIAAAKAKLGTTFATGALGVETNPPPVVGSTYINQDTPLDPIKTAGATTSADAGQPIRHMVASGFGLPDPMLSGDPNQGTLATAKSLDRPTELQFLDRQELWKEIYGTLLAYAIYCAVLASEGPLRGIAQASVNEYGEVIVTFSDNIDSHIDIDFPPILEHDIQEDIGAIKTGATLDGQIPTIIPDKKFLAKLILTRLGVDDIDELVDTWFPDETAIDTPEIAEPLADLNNQLEALREAITKWQK